MPRKRAPSNSALDRPLQGAKAPQSSRPGFKGAVPEDLAAEKQTLIRKQLAKAQEVLASCELARGDIETTLRQALDLVQNCQTAYRQAKDDQQRREWNQFAFVKVEVDIDQVTEAELSPVVASLVQAGRRTYRRDAPTPGNPWEDERGSREPVFVGGGSNVGVLVGPTGFEPVTSRV